MRHESDKLSLIMNDHALLVGLIEGFSFLVFERQQDATNLQQIGPTPDWCLQFSREDNHETSTNHSVLSSPFLEHFFPEAHEFWNTHQEGCLKSGLWSEESHDGKDYQCEAIALACANRKILIIQQVGSGEVSLQEVLQTAREGGLQHHKELTSQKKTADVLGGKLEQSERLRDDLVAIFDRLQLGTIMTDAEGRITFLSHSAQSLLKTTEQVVIGKPWSEISAFSDEDQGRLRMMWERPAHDRARVPVVIEQGKGRRVSLEIDLQEDPRNPQRTIFFLYDVTEVQDLRGLLTERSRFFDLVGKSSVMMDVYQRIQDIAPVEAPVVIEGETGTGKELVARALHQASPRKDAPFIAVNCAGLTDSLLGSQLFGHKRGAFTGATHDHQGFFEAANSGTLFLDEIGDMPLSIQTTLLRVLQEKEIVRLGESHPRKVDVRVVSATHQNLEELVKTGTFRSDLWYRIRVARVRLPALRDRREDIPLLSSIFFGQSRAATKKDSVQEISAEAMQTLVKYTWPGNVRELKSALEYAFIHCRSTAIQVSDLPPEMVQSPLPTVGSLDPTMDEKEQIVLALKRAKGKRAEAARILGMSRSTFYRRLEGLGISAKS